MALTEGDLRDIASDLGHEWEELGTRLTFRRSQIQQFRSDNTTVLNAAFHMLVTWKEKTDIIQHKDLLLNAFEKTRRYDLVKKVQEVLAMKNPKTQDVSNGTNINGDLNDTAYCSGTDLKTSFHELQYSLEEKVEEQKELSDKLNCMENSCLIAITESVESKSEVIQRDKQLEEERNSAKVLKEEKLKLKKQIDKAVEQFQQHTILLNDALEIAVTESAEKSYKIFQLECQLEEMSLKHHEELVKLQDENSKTAIETSRNLQQISNLENQLQEMAGQLKITQEQRRQGFEKHSEEIRLHRKETMMLKQSIINDATTAAEMAKSYKLQLLQHSNITKYMHELIESLHQQQSNLLWKLDASMKGSTKLKAKHRRLKHDYSTSIKSSHTLIRILGKSPTIYIRNQKYNKQQQLHYYGRA